MSDQVRETLFETKVGPVEVRLWLNDPDWIYLRDECEIGNLVKAVVENCEGDRKGIAECLAKEGWVAAVQVRNPKLSDMSVLIYNDWP